MDLLEHLIEIVGKQPHELTKKTLAPELIPKLNILKKYFVGREDGFLVKYKGKKYFQVKKNLSDDVLIGFLNGEYNLALYPHYKNKKNDKARNKWRVRWLGLDVDCHNEDFTPENMEKLSKSCDILISNCKKFFLFDDPKYIIKERSIHGWHLFIILKKDTSQEKALFYRDIIFNNINQFFKERHDFIDYIEFFPFYQVSETSYDKGLKPLFHDTSDLNEKVVIHELDINFFIKERQEKYSEYLRNSRRKIKSYSQNRVNSDNIYTEKTRFCELGEIHKNNLEWFLSKYYGGQCIKNIINGLIQCGGGAGHTMRIKVVNKLNFLGFSEEVIIQAFEKQRDFDYDKTKKMVKDVMKRNYAPPSCKNTRNIGFCDEKNCSKMKPTFLEYNYLEQLPQEIHGWNELHDKIADLIKSKKRYFLRKTTRSGTTTTVIVQMLRLKKKLIMIAPTNRIYNETLKEAINIGIKEGYLSNFRLPLNYRIGANIDICDKLKEIVQNFEGITDVFPFLLKNQCAKCELSGLTAKYNKDLKEVEIKRVKTPKCQFQKVLANLDDYGIIYLSTQKFKALINSSKNSKEARKLLSDLVNWCDYIFFDECYHLLSVNFKDYELYTVDENGNKTNNLDNVFEIVDKLRNKNPNSGFLAEFDMFLRQINAKIERIFLTTEESKLEVIPNSWFKYIITSNRDWVKWYSIMINYFKKTKDRNLKKLVEIYLSLSSKKMYIQQHISLYGERKIILACVDDISQFINWTNELQKPFLMTDAVKPPIPLNKLFDNLIEFNINDPMGTAKKQTIVICQQYDPFFKGFKNENKQLVKDFLKKYGSDIEIFLVSQSKRYTKYINYILEDEKKRIMISVNTHHNSDLTIGTASDLRRMLCVGSSFIPRHSYDYVADVYKNLGYFPDKYDTQDIANVLENHIACLSLFQTLSRVKDPKGKRPSVVFILGMKGQVIANWFSQLGIAVPRIISEKEYNKSEV